MECLPPASDDIAMCQACGVYDPQKERGRHPMDTAIGVDLAESAFQLPGVTMTGEVKLRKSSRVCSF